jgi:hypothetical protein
MVFYAILKLLGLSFVGRVIGMLYALCVLFIQRQMKKKNKSTSDNRSEDTTGSSNMKNQNENKFLNEDALHYMMLWSTMGTNAGFVIGALYLYFGMNYAWLLTGTIVVIIGSYLYYAKLNAMSATMLSQMRNATAPKRK